VAHFNGHAVCVELLEGAVQIHKHVSQRGHERAHERAHHKHMDDSPCSDITNRTARSDLAEPLLHTTSATSGNESPRPVRSLYDIGPEAAKLSEAAGVTATREMCFAASKGLLDEVKRLLKKRADHNGKDYDSRTAIHLAICGNHLPVVEFLYSQKANIDVQDRWGHTPLEDAITHNQTDIADWLRTHGATQSGHLAAHRLCRAAANGNLSMLETIYSEGIDLNLSNTDGRTALHLAASEGFVTVVEWLINHGVNTSPVDCNGSTPHEDAMRARHADVAVLLKGKEVYRQPPDHSIELC